MGCVFDLRLSGGEGGRKASSVLSNGCQVEGGRVGGCQECVGGDSGLQVKNPWRLELEKRRRGKKFFFNK